MRWKHHLLAVTLSLGLGVTPPAPASPDVRTVVTEGVASFDASNPGRALEEAINVANRLAVEQALGVYVEAQTLVENMVAVRDSILTQSSGYISGYKILSQNKGSDGLYHVKVESTVSIVPLVDKLGDMGLLREWTVAVVLVSNTGKRASNEAAVTRLNQQILAKGFKLADPQALTALNQPAVLDQLQKGNNLAALPILREQGVDVLVVGSTLSRPNAEGPIETYGGVKTVMTQGRIDARVIRVDTGEILATQSFQAVAGGSSQDLAETKAIDQAASKASEFFIVEIAKLPAATSAKIQLAVKGLSFARERAFMTALQQVKGIRKVIRSAYLNQMASYEIDFQGKADALADALIGAAGLKAFGFDIQGVTAGKIDASAK